MRETQPSEVCNIFSDKLNPIVFIFIHTTAEETNTIGSIGITTVVGPPGIAAVVIILLGGICIAKKRHKVSQCTILMLLS